MITLLQFKNFLDKSGTVYRERQIEGLSPRNEMLVPNSSIFTCITVDKSNCSKSFLFDAVNEPVGSLTEVAIAELWIEYSYRKFLSKGRRNESNQTD